MLVSINMMFESVLVYAAQNAGNSLNLFWGLIFMVILGSIIIWVIGTLIFFIPATIVAGVIWFLTGNPDYTGAAFLIIAAVSILKKK
jgi:hypothetical protein